MKNYLLSFLFLSTFFISSCASNKSKNKTDESGPEIQVPISVGSILTKLEVTEYESFNLPKNQIRAIVLEVLGYGANAETLKTQSIITLSFSETDSFSSLSNIKEGEVFNALIKKSIAPPNSTGSTSTWRIVELKN